MDREVTVKELGLKLAFPDGTSDQEVGEYIRAHRGELMTRYHQHAQRQKAQAVGNKIRQQMAMEGGFALQKTPSGQIRLVPSEQHRFYAPGEHARELYRQGKEAMANPPSPLNIASDLLERAVPGFHETLSEQKGFYGAAAKTSAGLLESLPLLAATAGLGGAAAKAATGLFTALNAKQLGETLTDAKMRKEDPKQWIATFIANATLTGLGAAGFAKAHGQGGGGKGPTEPGLSEEAKGLLRERAQENKAQSAAPPRSRPTRKPRPAAPQPAKAVAEGKASPASQPARTRGKAPSSPGDATKPAEATVTPPSVETRAKGGRPDKNADAAAMAHKAENAPITKAEIRKRLEAEGKPVTPGNERAMEETIRKEKGVPLPKAQGAATTHTITKKPTETAELDKASETLKPVTQKPAQGVVAGRPKPKPKVVLPEGATGARNAVTEQEMTKWGLTTPDKQHYTVVKEAWEQGRKAVEKGVDARSLARAVAEKPRPLTTEDVGVLVHDRVGLIREYDRVLDALQKEKDPQRLSDLDLQKERIEADMTTNTTALQRGGREQSAAFNARRLLVSRAYTVLEQKALLRSAAETSGKPVTAKNAAYAEKLAARVAETERQIAAHEKTIAEQQATIEDLGKRAMALMAKESRATGRRVKTGDIRQQREAIKKSIQEKLSRLQSGIPGDILPDVARLAKTYVAEGVNKFPDLVDKVHEFLSDHIEDLDKHDVRDAISGYGKTAKPSEDPTVKQLAELKSQMRLVSAIEDAQARQQPAKSGFQPGKSSEQVNALRAQLRETMLRQGLKEPTTRDALKAAKTRIQNQITELEGKLARRDFTRTKRQRVQLDEEGARLQGRLQTLKGRMDAQIEALKPKSPWQTIANLHREFILSGPPVFEKLFGATMWGYPTETAADIVGAGLRNVIPGYRRLSEISGREGAPLGPTLRGAVRGGRAILSRGAVRHAAQTIKQGINDLTTLAGVKPKGTELGGYVGRLHGAEKSFLQTGEFNRSLQIRSEMAVHAGKNLADPEVRSEIARDSAVDGWNQILQGENKLSTAISSAIGAVERQSPLAGTVMKTLAPITRVPANLLGRTIEMTGVGIPRGAYLQVKAAIRSRAGIEITPQEAGAIIRAYKYGGLGLAAAYIGWNQPEFIQAGGWYSPDVKKAQQGELKPDELKIAGHTVPKILAHSPFANAIQFWATLRRGFERGGVASGVADVAGGVAEQTPGIEATKQTAEAMFGREGAKGKAVGAYLRGLTEPQLLQWLAGLQDQGTQRKPRGVSEEMKMGIPWWRQTVPTDSGTSKGITAIRGVP